VLTNKIKMQFAGKKTDLGRHQVIERGRMLFNAPQCAHSPVGYDK